MELHQTPSMYEKVIHEDEIKQEQIRLTVNTFRDIEYLSIRKYYRDFEGEWAATPQGVNFPITIENSAALLVGLTDILSQAEASDLLEAGLGDLLNSINS